MPLGIKSTWAQSVCVTMTMVNRLSGFRGSGSAQSVSCGRHSLSPVPEHTGTHGWVCFYTTQMEGLTEATVSALGILLPRAKTEFDVVPLTRLKSLVVERRE